jgi:tetratricopeptide (TPR) repeat protein
MIRMEIIVRIEIIDMVDNKLSISVKVALDILLSESNDNSFFSNYKNLIEEIEEGNNMEEREIIEIQRKISKIKWKDNIYAQCLYALSISLIDNTKIEESIKILTKLEDKYPITSTCIAMIYMNNGKYDKAIEFLLKAYKRHHEYALKYLYKFIRICKISDMEFEEICCEGLVWNSVEAKIRLNKLIINSCDKYHSIIFDRCVNSLVKKIQKLEYEKRINNETK